jgi:phosphatidylglycerophosphate synthase
VRLDVTPAVGNRAARSVRGHSAGADVVILGGVPGSAAAAADLAQSLAEVVPGARRHDLDGPNVLAELAALAGADCHRPLVVAAADLEVSPVALLDLLDRPGDPTATAVLDPGGAGAAGPAVPVGTTGFPLLRTHPERRDVLSAGTARHTVTSPTALGAGVLRVAPRDRAEAASLWRAAADSASAQDPAVAPADLALLAVVRGGLVVGALALGPFSVRRGAASATGATGSPWQQRLRGASRGGDGFFSTFVIRPLSRRVTAIGLAHGWSPNVVTVCSLLLGIVASALAAIDNRWTWAVAAVLLLAALVVDCVDGEIARFTRRFSALGAWLDAVGDRVKEYSLIAAVAWVAARRGDSAWGLATMAMVLITLRHLEDYAYVHRQRASLAGIRPDRLDVDEPRDLGPADARTDLSPPRTGTAVAAFWAKKVMHLPIAERYLLLALGLLTFDPHLVLWAMIVAVTAAMVWTLGGRAVKAVLRRDGYLPEPLPEGGRGHLDHQLDLGPLARLTWRAGGLPFPAALAGVALVLTAALAAQALSTPAVVAAVIAGTLLMGAGCRPPLRHLFAWLAPLLLWLAEGVLVVSLVHESGGVGASAFAYLAAVAWHRYDVVYRLRDTGEPAAAWVTPVTLGVDGRIVVLTLLWAASVPLAPVLAWSALVLFLLYAAESATGWRAWVRAQPVPAATEKDSPEEVVEE